MEGHELWSFQNALLFVILMILVIVTLILGSRTTMDIKKIKEDWPNQRCSPLIMPFANWFGFNAKENFEFCMGKIFNTHSQSYLGSITGIFIKFTGLMQMIFQSVNSIRNTIASLGGGINVIFQEFTERISMFFFRLRLSSIHLKSLFMRMYALLFSVMYMGFSGIAGMTTFTNTYLFSFLDTFCFPKDTLLRVIRDKKLYELPIHNIHIGDQLYPSMDRVTACFQFHARGQQMVQLGRIKVSTNHYLYENGKRVRADSHTDAINIGTWDSDEPLYCLNTHTHHIPIDGYVFMDYDEMPSADEGTMRWVEEHVNGGVHSKKKDEDIYSEYGMAMDPLTRIRMKSGEIKCAMDLEMGDELSTGSTIAGVIQKRVKEWVITKDGIGLTPTTLYWNEEGKLWERIGWIGDTTSLEKEEKDYCSFVVVPQSQIELENGIFIRDYMEWCSPDTEKIYSEHLHKEIEDTNK